MKKSKRIGIVLLMSLFVTSAGTFAYFTDTATIEAGNSSTPLKLDITNGKISVQAAVGGGTTDFNWYYDPVDDSANGNSPDILGLGINKDYNASHTDNAVFSNNGILKRWKTGAPVIGVISNTRPGDGFSIGQILDNTGNNTDGKKGVEIINESTLTVKLKLVIDEINGYSTYKSLKDAGWKLYIDDSIITDEVSNADTESSGSLENLKANIEEVMTSKQILLPGTNTNIKINLRFPTYQNNDYMEGGTKSSQINDFDINKLIGVVATQENNPGWNQ